MPKKPLPTSGFSAGRALRCSRKGPPRRAPNPADARTEARAWREELAGIEQQLNDPAIPYGQKVRLEPRKIVLEARLKTAKG